MIVTVDSSWIPRVEIWGKGNRKKQGNKDSLTRYSGIWAKHVANPHLLSAIRFARDGTPLASTI